MRKFSVFAAASFVQFSAIGMGCVEIRPEYVESSNFFVREPNNRDNKILKFQIKIDSSSVKKENGNLVFNIKLTNVEPVKKDMDLSDIAIENGGLRDLHMKLNSGGVWESDPIKITIPEENLSNTRFRFSTTNQVKLLLRNDEKIVDTLRFSITPTLSISIPEGENKVNFGRIVYDGGVVRSLQKHTFHLNYQCITDADLIITSDHNFQLKEKKSDNYLPVRISLLINGEKIKVSPELHQFLIPSNRNDFQNNIEGKCYIKYATNLCPMAGIYAASILFTIQAK